MDVTPVQSAEKQKSHVVKHVGITLLIVLVLLFIVGGLSSFLISGLSTARNKSTVPQIDTFSNSGFGRLGLDSAVSPVGSEIATAQDLTLRKIVKDGVIGLLVLEAKNAVDSITKIALNLQGFVQNSSVRELSAGTEYGSITIRVPAVSFEVAMSQIKEVGIEVESEEVDAKDVTEQFIDLEARLKNAKAEAEQFQRLLERTNSINDISNISSKLFSVQQRVEQLEGQLRFLNTQIDMSSIRVTLTEEADVKILGIKWKPLYNVKRSFRNMVSGFATSIDYIVAIVLYLPVIILWTAILVLLGSVVWKLIHWIRRKFFSGL